MDVGRPTASISPVSTISGESNSPCAVRSQANGPGTDEGLGRLHASPEHQSLRLKFIEKTIQAILPCIRELIPRANLNLVKDPTTSEQYLQIQKSYFMSTEQFRHCVMAIVNKLNSIINRWDRRYGLFWTEKDLIDNSVINLRFNATDVIDKIVRDPSIECLLRSSFAPTYYPDMIHNADDLVKYQILDSFKEQLEREAHEDVLFGYDSRSKAMTFYFRNFIERNQFLKLVNQYNDKFNTDLRAGVLREKLLSSGSIFQPMSYTLEFIPTKGFGYEGYKAETLGNHFLMAELIDRNPMALTEDLLTKFV